MGFVERSRLTMGFGFLLAVAVVALVLVSVAAVLGYLGLSSSRIGRRYDALVIGLLDRALRPLDALAPP